MATQTMIERVARAMLAVDYPDDVGGDMEEMWWDRRGDAYLEYARAAIEAMREPTKAMEMAGYYISEDMRHVSTYIAMIDAALEEKPE